MLALAKMKVIAVMMASLLGVGLLIYLYRKVKNYFLYRLRDLKALGIYHDRKKRFIPVNPLIKDIYTATT